MVSSNNGRLTLCKSILFTLMFATLLSSAMLLTGCDDDSSSSYDEPTTAAEEASHYHYDSEGHIYDDRD